MSKNKLVMINVTNFFCQKEQFFSVKMYKYLDGVFQIFSFTSVKIFLDFGFIWPVNRKLLVHLRPKISKSNNEATPKLVFYLNIFSVCTLLNP